ncbi:WD40-repeat-containing domain protein [Dipodascopsis tothii]|uniref:WD40-repeat-containing domain protein n=1 Tax=Dipodascopsis tothii TaxID=44089 RepID=UPI0034CFF234
MKWGYGAQNRKIGVASTNGACRLYDLDRPGEYTSIAGHKQTIRSVAFNRFQSYMMLTGCHDRMVRIWDSRTNSFMAKLPAPDQVYGAQFSPIEGAKFAAVFNNGSLYRWDMRNMRVPERRIVLGAPGYCMDWHPDADVIATGGRDAKIQVWDLTAFDCRRPKYTIDTMSAVSGVSWGTAAPGRDVLAHTPLMSYSVSNRESRVHVWDVKRPRLPAHVFDNHTEVVTDAVWADDGVVWSVSFDGRVIQQDMRAGGAVRPVDAVAHQAFAWGPDDHFVVAALDKARLRKDGLMDRDHADATNQRLVAGMADLAVADARAAGPAAGPAAAPKRRTLSFRSLKAKPADDDDAPFVPSQYVAVGSVRALERGGTFAPSLPAPPPPRPPSPPGGDVYAASEAGPDPVPVPRPRAGPPAPG